MDSKDPSRDVEQEILALEKRYWQALKENDVTTALQLTDFPCIITGPQGLGRVDEQTFMQMMKASPYSIDDFELNDAQVRVLRDDVAVVAYKAHEELTVEGKPLTLDVTDSSTWIKRDGRWVCALHTEAIQGDPFGRDRSRAKV
ncbi:MAG TPA: nuclear transport factor 2 family protein [Polyangiaceae bacterium]|nr:nuclear transport factor 2 family protein [Polyangiaceae bacterium]